ncbi:hypothetical protein [Mycobacteroides abscessus]|uniref:hypothetical protein n=1 Tax=Mycobacteroides abscessus TaxID=36809 RepID=UPI0009A64376|nr:hypothetical protein [Mycobacteroides abscessus]SLJ19968.1 Uncharacterised protein [Mycobacteroides abscessus subsp. abscessus]SLJ24704.1 Uncharacterised protein [Mycobacteroides abscessus subsp. abscessus]SLJ49248.1 Uncharacterised protein [Mycobacteroides abscessus subsp. abscessus]SLK57098.1 Uncharacterised protein [Mycobacteroides abscessus subsp. abscessus]
MSKLEPTEAQRKALVDKLSEHVQWHRDGVEMAVDEMIAAANSIPEGAPVGTIARASDGHNIAVRKRFSDGVHWAYLYDSDVDIFGYKVADSWPVIFAPGEAVGSGPTTDGGETYDPREPSREELRAYFHQDLAEHCQADDPDEVEELAKWLSIHIGTWPEDEWELRSKPNYYHDRARELLDFGYRKVSDATAQQEPGVSDPRSTSSYGLSRNEPVAPKPPRTPRVRDRLGVDEQGARWLDSDGGQVLFNTDQWMRLRPDGTVGWFGVDYEPTETAPYVELIEPRVLPSLDCEEARDGTVWEARYVLLVGREQTPGWKFQHTQDGWVYEDGSRVLSPEFLTGRGPYTEVLGDPS